MASPASLDKAVWQTADTYLRGVVPRQSYGDYILPFTVLRRLEFLLEPTKDAVLQTLKHTTFPESMWDAIIQSSHGLTFYNTSELSLATIGGSDDHVKKACSPTSMPSPPTRGRCGAPSSSRSFSPSSRKTTFCGVYP
jgi:type I restriction enzyme M protein